MKKYIVRAADENFVITETFDDINEAIAYEDKLIGIFGSWNVEVYADERKEEVL